MKYDFGGWATRNDLQCADGRVIKKDAFKGQNGQTVPLVWMHNHADPANVLGLAHLENRDEGVYAFCEFNDTESGKTARELVKHGDVQSLSILSLIHISLKFPRRVFLGSLFSCSSVYKGL